VKELDHRERLKAERKEINTRQQGLEILVILKSRK
jgi:hypothetical protein